jgi:hypothetical protein
VRVRISHPGRDRRLIWTSDANEASQGPARSTGGGQWDGWTVANRTTARWWPGVRPAGRMSSGVAARPQSARDRPIVPHVIPRRIA